MAMGIIGEEACEDLLLIDVVGRELKPVMEFATVDGLYFEVSLSKLPPLETGLTKRGSGLSQFTLGFVKPGTTTFEGFGVSGVEFPGEEFVFGDAYVRVGMVLLLDDPEKDSWPFCWCCGTILIAPSERRLEISLVYIIRKEKRYIINNTTLLLDCGNYHGHLIH